MKLQAKNLLLSLLLFLSPNSKSIPTINEVQDENIIPHYSMSGIAGTDSDCDYKQNLRTKQFNYFKNLTEYSPYNRFDTCSFVSLIQVLSYWDNFYDDNIIEEKYDRKTENQSPYLLDSELVSPGVEKGNYQNTYATIQDTVLNTCSWDYQYELVRRYNKYYAANKQNKNKPAEYQNAFRAIEIQEVTDNCLPIKPKSVFARSGLTQQEYRSLTKKYIDNGIPVILNIETAENTNAHAVVAYDYDASGKIYANFGWNKEDNHIDIESYR